MKEFGDKQWLHFALNVCDEEHSVSLDVDQIVLWCNQNWANLLRVGRLLHLCPKCIAACPADLQKKKAFSALCCAQHTVLLTEQVYEQAGCIRRMEYRRTMKRIRYIAIMLVTYLGTYPR